MSKIEPASQLMSIFSEFRESEICYVVPRKYDHLQKKPLSTSDDVDIIIQNSDYEKALNICKECGFSPTSTLTERIQTLAGRALAEPRTAFDMLIDSPREVLSLVFADSANSYNHRNDKLYRGELMLDPRNGLAYKSPMDGTRIRVDPAVDRGLLERKKTLGKISVPSPPDELAHIISHCLFDKKGDFDQYYQNRCSNLFTQVQNDPELDEVFRRLLNLIFFDADYVVYSSVEFEELNDLLDNLYAFADY